MRRFVVLFFLAAGLAVRGHVDVTHAGDGPATTVAAANRSPREEREARARLLTERRKAIVAAVTEARTEDGLRLLDDHLREAEPGSHEYYEWSDDCRLLDRLVDICRDASGGADHETRVRLAREAIGVVLARRPDRVFEDSWEQLHRSPPTDGLPRFLLPKTVVPFAPEVRLRAEGNPDLAPATRLFRLLRPEKVEFHETRGTGIPECVPHRFDPADLVEIDREIVWGPPEARSWTTAVADYSATVRLDSPGMYVLRQERDGIRYDQPIDIPTFRLDVRWLERHGWPHTLMAVDYATGRGMADVEVTLLGEDQRDKGREPFSIKLGRTDARGLLSAVLPATGRRDRMEIEGRRGSEIHRRPIDVPRGQCIAAAPAVGDPLDRQPFLFVTTDQPLYRPGETVRYRAVVRDAGGGLIASSNEPVRVEIRDADGRLCHAVDHRWGRFGSLTGVWTVPDGASLGTCSVAVTGPPVRLGAGIDPMRSATIFEVADVRVPQFAARVVPGTEPDTATVRAEFFTGGAVADADVHWRVVAVEDEGEAEDHTRRRRSFEQLSPLDDTRAWLVDARIDAAERERNLRPNEFGGEFASARMRWTAPSWKRPIAEGSGRTGADGSALIAWTGRADGSRPPRVRVHARVRDASRLAADGQAEIVPSGGPLRLEVGTDRLFTLPDEPLEVRLRASRPDGAPLEGVEVTLLGLIDSLKRAGGRSDAPPSHREFLRRTLRTDARGRARLETRVPESGRVRWRAEALPPGGGTKDAVVARADLWSAGGNGWLNDEDQLFGGEHLHHDAADDPVAAGNGARRLDPAAFPLETEDGTRRLRITPDRFSYAAGETIRLLVRGVDPSRHVVAGIETRTSRREATFEIHRPMEVIELPVTAEDRGLATIWVRSWSGREFEWDQRDVFIHPSRHLLDVVVNVDGDGHRPGGKVSVDVEVRGHDGAARRAEVELALVDEALASLVDAPPIHPLASLDPIQAVNSSCGGRTWMTFAAEPGRPDQLAGRPLDGAGATRAIEETGLYRGDRRDLGWSGPALFIVAGGGHAVSVPDPEPAEPAAMLEGIVVTGADGRARAAIALPDRSTRYRLVARAVTREGEAGMGETEFVVRRPLDVSLVAPSFLHVGDRSIAAAIVTSALDRTAEVTLRLRANGTTRVERVERMEPGERRRIEWDLEAGAAGATRLEAEAEAEDESATAVFDMPVRPAAVEHRVVVTGLSWEGLPEPPDGEIDWPDGEADTEIDVVVGPQRLIRIEGLLWEKLDTPNTNIGYDSEQYLGRAVEALRVLTDAGLADRSLQRLAREKVEILLPGVVAKQHPDGSWRVDGKPCPDRTATILECLLAARDVGVSVDRRVIDDAMTHLESSGADAFSLATRALGGDDRARDSLREAPVGDLVDDLDETFRWSSSKPVSPREKLARLVLAGRHDLLPLLPVAPPGEGAARSVRSAAEAGLALRAITHADPDSDAIGPLAEWILRRAWQEEPFAVLATAILLADRSGDEDSRRWSLDVNGEAAVVDACGSLRLKTRALRRGKNTLTLRSNDAGSFGATLTLRGLAYTPTAGDSEEDAEPLLRRTIERRVIAAGGREERWEPVESGATVALHDMLRVVLRCPAMNGAVIEVPLAAGLEPVSAVPGPVVPWPIQADDEQEGGMWRARPDRIFAERISETSDDMIAVEVQPTLPGRYRIPPAVVRLKRGVRAVPAPGCFVGVGDYLTEPFEIVVEE